MLKHLDEHYSLLVGTPTGLSLDLFSMSRDSFFTPSFAIWRGWLSQSPPSTTRLEKQWQDGEIYANRSLMVTLGATQILHFHLIGFTSF
ncbi:hypothetical protein V6Z12_D05G362200 [Gossypium hirsutum]